MNLTELLRNLVPPLRLSIVTMALLKTTAALALAVASVGSSSLSGSTGALPLQLVRPPKVGIPKPTPQQLQYGGSINALVHFNMATFLDGETCLSADHFVTPTANWIGMATARTRCNCTCFSKPLRQIAVVLPCLHCTCILCDCHMSGCLVLPRKRCTLPHLANKCNYPCPFFRHAGDTGCVAANWRGCDSNGGCNSSNPQTFNPTNLNVSNWIVSMKDLGATSAVLTGECACVLYFRSR